MTQKDEIRTTKEIRYNSIDGDWNKQWYPLELHEKEIKDLKETIEKIRETIHLEGECACCDDVYEILKDSKGEK